MSADMFTRGRRNFQKLLIMEHSRADGVPKQFNPKIGRYKGTRSSDSLLHTLTYSYPHISLEDVLIKTSEFGGRSLTIYNMKKIHTFPPSHLILLRIKFEDLSCKSFCYVQSPGHVGERLRKFFRPFRCEIWT